MEDDDFAAWAIVLVIYWKVSAIFLIYLACISLPNYRRVVAISRTIQVPPSPSFVQSILIPGVIGIVGAIWQLVSPVLLLCLRGFKHPRSVLALCGISDLIFGGLLIASIVFQAQYLPHSLSGCKVRNYNLGIEDFLKAAALKNETTTEDQCRTLVDAWNLTVFLATLLSITAALGIFSPSGKIILLCLFPFWGPFAGIYYVIKWAWPVLRLLKPIFLALGRLLKWIWNFVVRPAFHLILLPFKLCGWALRRIIPAKRFVVRSFHNFAKRQHHKALLRKIGSSRERLLSGLANPDAETSEGKESFELDDVDADLQNAFEGSLIELLRRRRILQGIVENSHFSDLYNLSRTSKDIRDSLLPLQQKQSVVTFFRHKSCASGSKSPCWCCGIQICPICSSDSNLQIPQTTSHLYFCEPQCSKCYFENSCRKKTIHCNCLQSRKLNLTRTKICHNCASLPKQIALEQIEEKERMEILHLGMRRLKCSTCKMSLAETGPRWWSCSKCGKECRSDYHLPWSYGIEN